jgi:methyl-accepting chemotaxis protein
LALFSNESVGRRFGVTFAVTATLLAALSLVAMVSLWQTRSKSTSVVNEDITQMTMAQNVLATFYQMEIAEEAYLSQASAESLDHYHELSARLDASFELLTKAGQRADRALAGNVSNLLADYHKKFDQRAEVLTGHTTLDDPKAFGALNADENRILGQLEESLKKLASNRVDEATGEIGDMTESVGHTFVLVILALVFGVAGLMVIYLIGRGVVLGVRRLATEIDAIAKEGSLRRRVDVRGNDELAQVGIAFNGLLQEQSVLEEQARRIASGNLKEEVAGRGELATTFNVMVRAVRESTNALAQMAEADRNVKHVLEATIRQYREFVDAVAAGDLRRRLAIAGDGDLGTLGHQLNSMAARLEEVANESGAAVQSLTGANAEVLSAATQLNSTVAEQAASLVETTTTMEEVRNTSQQSAETAQDVIALADRVQEVGSAGQRAAERSVEGMKTVHACVQVITQTILTLNERSQQIGEIINAVNDLADQSNLLAVNASIEAAKAGEQGKGFAVVAMEVRNLAEQSKQATRQVRSILNEAQKAIQSAVLSTEEGMKKSESGLQTTVEAGTTIQNMAEMLQQALQAARQIAAGARQQSIGVDQVATALKNLRQASDDSSRSAKQLEVSARGLKELGDRLKRLSRGGVTA